MVIFRERWDGNIFLGYSTSMLTFLAETFRAKHYLSQAIFSKTGYASVDSEYKIFSVITSTLALRKSVIVNYFWCETLELY